LKIDIDKRGARLRSQDAGQRAGRRAQMSQQPEWKGTPSPVSCDTIVA
jgi:hypothetical protein